ncbi:hypothetical protein MML48_2g00000317 [Holotrichia oblita]|uniref:Uncharacterized protein n=1 Tax=Holotrichia oblita TaxID=644536 RepID=A0ACB9TJZ2_HOLOL|nr:hypothetical protein MML48_2g00000317 [Holotrichia oblita]
MAAIVFKAPSEDLQTPIGNNLQSSCFREENCLDVLNDSTRVFNCDETGIQTCPKTGLLLGPKGYTNFYNIASGKEKESITVLCTFSAEGDILPPMLFIDDKKEKIHIQSNYKEKKKEKVAVRVNK